MSIQNKPEWKTSIMSLNTPYEYVIRTTAEQILEIHEYIYKRILAQKRCPIRHKVPIAILKPDVQGENLPVACIRSRKGGVRTIYLAKPDEWTYQPLSHDERREYE